MSADAVPLLEDEPAKQASGTSRIAAAAGIMVAAILLSRVLGIVRDMVVAHYFGANVSIVADAYKAAFSLPDLFYFMIAGGALSSAFIPVFTEYLTKGDEENAWEVFSVFGTVIVLGLTLVIVIGELFTEPLLSLLVPGFTREKLALTASLTRIIFPAQLCFFVGGLMISTLYARNRFLMPALGPVIYNVFIILGGVIGGAFFGAHWGIYGLAWGVVIGAFVGNVLMQLWEIRRVGVRYRPSLNVRHPGVIRVAKLMLPVILGLSLPQLCIILTRPFASMIPGDGPITWLDNASKIMQMPLGIFAQGVSVAIFPSLSALAAQQDWPGLREKFSLGLRSILFLTIPSAVLIIVLAVPITAALFQRGKWTWDDTTATAAATVFFSIAIFAVSGQAIVNRGFYAMQNTLTPSVIGLFATLSYLALNWLFTAVLKLGTDGLAISYSAINILMFTMLLVVFRRKIGGLPMREIGSSLGRVSLAAVPLGLVAWGCREAFERLFDPYGPGYLKLGVVLAQIVTASLAGGAVYLAGVKLLGVPEAEFVFSTVTGRFGRLLGRRRGGEARRADAKR